MAIESPLAIDCNVTIAVSDIVGSHMPSADSADAERPLPCDRTGREPDAAGRADAEAGDATGSRAPLDGEAGRSTKSDAPLILFVAGGSDAEAGMFLAA